MLARGSISGSVCGPNGPWINGGISRINHIPDQWGRVYPHGGYRQPHPCPQDIGYGGYPQYQPAPMFGYQPQQPPVYRYYQNTNNSATATTGGSR
ncbi:MAG: hypothetical protein KBB54_00005, partial [Candidatus Pacebacteria bacterium]|nr:hypothetical protein [Candidatus Paceibacterota bacterium]